MKTIASNFIVETIVLTICLTISIFIKTNEPKTEPQTTIIKHDYTPPPRALYSSYELTKQA